MQKHHEAMRPEWEKRLAELDADPVRGNIFLPDGLTEWTTTLFYEKKKPILSLSSSHTDYLVMGHGVRTGFLPETRSATIGFRLTRRDKV